MLSWIQHQKHKLQKEKKTDKQIFIKIRTFCVSKGQHQENEKTTYRIIENIYKSLYDKGDISEYIQQIKTIDKLPN